MTTIFLSHSEDDKNTELFRRVAKSMGITLYCVEVEGRLEGMTKPWSKPIIDKIRKSHGVIVLLSKEVCALKSHTRNWVSFETGVGAGFGKPIAVCYPVTLKGGGLKKEFSLEKGEFEFAVPYYDIEIQFPTTNIGTITPEEYIREIIFSSFPWECSDVKKNIKNGYKLLVTSHTCSKCGLTYIIARLSNVFQCYCCGKDTDVGETTPISPTKPSP
jgi:ribosomal protein L37AE/L43A